MSEEEPKLSDFTLDEERAYVKIGYAKEDEDRVIATAEGEISKLQFCRMLTQLQATNTLSVLNEVQAMQEVTDEVKQKAEDTEQDSGDDD